MASFLLITFIISTFTKFCQYKSLIYSHFFAFSGQICYNKSIFNFKEEHLMENIGKINGSVTTTKATTHQKFWNKFRNTFAKFSSFMNRASPIVCQISQSIQSLLVRIIRINYMSLIAALLLVMAYEAGLLESFPALQWLAGAELRLWNWFSGLIMDLANWIFTITPEIHIPILSDFFEWARYILLGS